MSTRAIDATEVRRAIDEEIAERIALHEASIRDLKTRRNAYSNTSILPPEVLSKIFLAAKDGIPGVLKEASWMNVAGVCQEWRSIALASPRMWSSIDISKPNCALEFLKRSKSAPLRINCKTRPLTITAANEEMVKSIIAEVSRIEELEISAITQGEIIRFLSDAGSAPLLRHLRLEVSVMSPSQDPFLLSFIEMPFLRHLDLERINISEFPPLPHLTHLAISLTSWSTMRPSSLLSSLRCSPKLEEIDITGLVRDSPGDSLPRVELPNLRHIALTSLDLEASVIFTHLEYPPSASVAFTSLSPPLEEPDLSSLVKVCGRFNEKGAPVIHRVHFDGHELDESLRLDVTCQGPPQGPPMCERLTIILELELRHYCVAFVALCSALPLEIVPTLGVGGFHDMTQAQWTTIFQRCKRIEKLRLNDVHLPVFQTLIKSSKRKAKSPRLVPKLQTIELLRCTFIDPDNHYANLHDSPSFTVFERFLKQRKHCNMPVKDVLIEMCEVTEDAVARLEQYTDIAWDGEEMDSGEEEEDDYYDSDGFDDLYGFAGF